MKISNTFHKLSGLLLACSLFPCYAIDPHRAMSQYVRDRWGPEQGFPRGSVYAIAQTPDGYLWIASEAGLVRFDGSNFTMIRDRSGSLTFSSVLGLATDKEGSLWLLLQDMTLIRYRNGKLENPIPAPESVANVMAMARSNSGNLLVTRTQMGAYTFRDGRLQLVQAAQGIPRSPLIAVSETGDGAVWIGTRGAGLYRLEGGKTSPVTKGLPNPKINCLLPDGANNMWIGTDSGIARWNGTGLAGTGIPESQNKFQALTMVKDRDGNLWVGTAERGLLRFNAQGLSTLDPADSQPRNAITTVFEDREGNLWIGSANGIERLGDSAFVTYSDPEGLPTGGPNPVYIDSENRLWFPPADGGLWWTKEGRHGTISLAGLDKDVVYSIAGGKNELWLGRQRGGMTRLQVESDSFAAKTYTIADGLAQNSVYSVYRARDGVVWAGTLSGGVSKLDGGKFTTYTTKDGLASNTVASILEGSDGTMWFATPNGLSSLKKDRWQTFKTEDGLPSENVNCLLEDSAGSLWVGTTTGLAFLRNGRFQIPSKTIAALQEQILGLAEDKYNSFWISTSNHVLRVKRKFLLGEKDQEELREFGLADGLRGVEGVKRHSSVVTDSLGRIWFSLNKGVSVVDPLRLTRSSAAAIAQIQTLSADGSEIELSGAVRVPAGRRRVAFSYAGLILSGPERVRFRYWLEGYDHGWSEPVAERTAVYTNLGPGPYRFRVMASNPDGAWSNSEASLAFSVAPAYWQTFWFQALLVLSVVLAALALYRLRLHQLTERLNVRFEERLVERTRIAQELHDTLLQGFLSASMHVDVAVDRLPADSPAKPSLTQALELMRQVTEEGRKALRGLRSSDSVTLDLESAFSGIQNELGGQIGEPASFRVLVEGERRRLHPVLRDEVYRIGREALINAFRHANAKHIEIELNYAPAVFCVTVRDDGQGIDPHILDEGRDGHWGLSGMRERAEQIGARLRLWSNVNRGTEIELSVPGNIAYQDPSKGGTKRFPREHSKVGEEPK